MNTSYLKIQVFQRTSFVRVFFIHNDRNGFELRMQGREDKVCTADQIIWDLVNQIRNDMTFSNWSIAIRKLSAIGTESEFVVTNSRGQWVQDFTQVISYYLLYERSKLCKISLIMNRERESFLLSFVLSI